MQSNPASAAASPAKRGAPRRQPRRLPPGPRRGAKVVLIVDDLADQREMYAGYLRHEGFQVVEASNGFEAIGMAVDLLPDAVVMDLAMPGLDGFDCTRVLKAMSLTRRIPVLAVTAHGEHLPAEWATTAGCDGFLRKPVLPSRLATEIELLLFRRRR
jgi:two-component system, cell cycle response regulator DivK